MTQQQDHKEYLPGAPGVTPAVPQADSAGYLDDWLGLTGEARFWAASRRALVIWFAAVLVAAAAICVTQLLGAEQLAHEAAQQLVWAAVGALLAVAGISWIGHIGVRTAAASSHDRARLRCVQLAMGAGLIAAELAMGLLASSQPLQWAAVMAGVPYVVVMISRDHSEDGG